MQPVERAEFEGVDYGWVMQTTFVVTILVGAPVVAVLSVFVTLDSWGARAAFAVRVGAPIWFLTAVVVAVYAKRTEAGDGGETDETPTTGPGDETDAEPSDETDARPRDETDARPRDKADTEPEHPTDPSNG